MDNPQKGRIFISYRRADSAGYAGRIYDRLTAHFGKDAVFMDVDAIDAGLDFVEVLQNAVQSCDVLAALIGRSWLNNKDAVGKRRLDNPEDFVRVEIAAALSRNIRVIPVLVDGVTMPSSTELPDDLKPLARRNALQVNHHSFNADANRLISQLESAFKAAEEERKREITEKAGIAARRPPYYEIPPRKDSSNVFSEEAKGDEKSTQANLFHKPKKLPLIIGVGIVILVILGYIIRNNFIQSAPSTPAENSSTITAEPEPTATETPEILSVGSTMISEKDSMVMVYVPAGEFQMGSEDGADDERPVHTVYLDAYWIDRTEVTNAMYVKCVAAGECNPLKSTRSYTRDSYYGYHEFDNYPVIYVSWNDANSYCNWVSRRLPTEAEWEKAAGWDEDARAHRVYPWGNSFDGRIVNFCDTNCSLDWKNSNYDDGYTDTAPVGNYPTGSSFYGAFDMAGNVYEWVSSLYQSYPYSATDGREVFLTIAPHVLRGGCWHFDEYAVRTSHRSQDVPSYTNDFVGFRCARDAE